METIDNREKIYQIDEIYKYKDLIELKDKNVIKQIVYCGDNKALSLFRQFMELVTKEMNHELNKVEFYAFKDNLIDKMKGYLNSQNIFPA